MDLTCVILFLVLYYIRPQEWSGLFSKIHFVQAVMLLAMATLVFRERKLSFKILFRTPHDWMMAAFFVWMIFTSGAPYYTFRENINLAIFYVVIVHTLYNTKRLNIFLGWWTFLIIAIAALAIASEYGYDPLGSFDITHGRMKGRLILNLSIFNNPNALGHNVAPCIPMLYFFCIWKRPLFAKELGALLFIIPIWCIYLTESKGAFIACFVILLATFTFGRPKIVQIILICAAIAFGGAVLYRLPRMNELNSSKTDGAIQGRVAAFKHGMKVLQNSVAGVGKGNWMDSFRRAHNYSKACHSSYIQVGAELGRPGLFLFIGMLYCCLRTLLTAKTTTVEDERIRRTLFVLVLAYIVSSWMIDFGFRSIYFMFCAATAAFHRQVHGLNDEDAAVAAALEDERVAPTWRPQVDAQPNPALLPAFIKSTTDALQPLLPQRPFAVAQSGGSHLPMQSREAQSTEITVTSSDDVSADAKSPKPKFWNRITLLDIVFMMILTAVAIRLWQEMINRM